jgi:hypothetical protein
MAPSVFIQTWYPEPRALILARFVLELTIFALGGLAGWFASGIFTREIIIRLARIATVLVVLASSLYAIRGAIRPLQEMPTYHQYAAQWDQRDAEIRQDRSDGVRDVVVVPLTHPLLGGGEVSEDAGHWYNNCIAGYYGVDSIRARSN